MQNGELHLRLFKYYCVSVGLPSMLMFFTVVNCTWGVINFCKISLKQVNNGTVRRMLDVHSMHRFIIIAQLWVQTKGSPDAPPRTISLERKQ